MKTKHKSGFSLIEIMISVLILTVLALGGSAVLYQTGGNIQKQGNKRATIEIVNELLEEARTINYLELEDYTSSRTNNGIVFTVSVVVTQRMNPFIDDAGILDVTTQVTYGGEDITVSSVVIPEIGILE